MPGNRIYIRRKHIAESLYRRSKEYLFTSDDVMRLHFSRHGKRAKRWAMRVINDMRRDGEVVRLDAKYLNPNKTVAYYRLTNDALRKWDIPFDPKREKLEPEPAHIRRRETKRRKKVAELKEQGAYKDGNRSKGRK